MELVFSVFLLIFIALQQVFFMRQVQKLIDKIMSRSFVEYKQVESPQKQAKRPEEPSDPEDLRVLNDFIPM